MSQLAGILISLGVSTLKGMVSDNTVRKIIIAMGDEIVKRTETDIDNKFWDIVRESLSRRLEGDETPIENEVIKEKLENA